jgi:hypothetical protein
MPQSLLHARAAPYARCILCSPVHTVWALGQALAFEAAIPTHGRLCRQTEVLILVHLPFTTCSAVHVESLLKLLDSQPLALSQLQHNVCSKQLLKG